LKSYWICKNETPFLYEAACCASIPIIRNLEEYDNDLLQSFQGIINGSTNFILTKIFQDKLEFRNVITGAAIRLCAEVIHKLDIGGFDAANKF
jgi:homoserine dehydrogenase